MLHYVLPRGRICSCESVPRTIISVIRYSPREIVRSVLTYKILLPIITVDLTRSNRREHVLSSTFETSKSKGNRRSDLSVTLYRSCKGLQRARAERKGKEREEKVRKGKRRKGSKIERSRCVRCKATAYLNRLPSHST